MSADLLTLTCILKYECGQYIQQFAILTTTLVYTSSAKLLSLYFASVGNV